MYLGHLLKALDYMETFVNDLETWYGNDTRFLLISQTCNNKYICGGTAHNPPWEEKTDNRLYDRSLSS